MSADPVPDKEANKKQKEKVSFKNISVNVKFKVLILTGPVTLDKLLFDAC